MKVIEHRERPIDRQAAAFLCRGAAGADEGIQRTVVSLLSQAAGQGHVCLALHDIASCVLQGGGQDGLRLPDPERLRRIILELPSVGVPGERKPLLLDHAGRLYLYRFRMYEQQVAEGILQRCAAGVDVDQVTLSEGLARLFPATAEGESCRQREAAESALRSRFSVISGGPGTGKTSTVVRILALLLEQPGGNGHRIAMAAPTGKASTRLTASIAALQATLPCSDAVRHSMPATVSTLHRLLGQVHGGGFRHHRENRLPVDTLIIDEASMVDLTLMAATIDALPGESRLILLGDRDQLASVEAGAVLGDICKAAEKPGSAVSGCLTVLERNFRFKRGSGLAELAHAINTGNAVTAASLVADSSFPAISWHTVADNAAMRRFMSKRLVDGYRPFLEAETPVEALRRFDRFRVLCSIREGPWGVEGINRLAESVLASTGLASPSGSFWRGRPVLVTENDYQRRLFNGDIGIILPDPASQGRLRAFFPSPDGTPQGIPPELLPKHESAFAMTVHKSQGSEFDEVLLLMPPADSPVLGRELLYTAVTRSRERLVVAGSGELFATAVARTGDRRSGLQDALSG